MSQQRKKDMLQAIYFKKYGQEAKGRLNDNVQDLVFLETKWFTLQEINWICLFVFVFNLSNKFCKRTGNISVRALSLEIFFLVLVFYLYYFLLQALISKIIWSFKKVRNLTVNTHFLAFSICLEYLFIMMWIFFIFYIFFFNYLEDLGYYKLYFKLEIAYRSSRYLIEI